MFRTIDLQFRKQAETIAAFLLESTEGPLLFECGPHSTYSQLVAGLAGLGYKPSDIAHVFLSHIHLDHAGAAWALAHEGAMIHVHPKGAPHLQNPERLWGSAKRIYGDAMEELWGVMKPIAAEKICEASGQEVLQVGEHKIVAHFTPGHAVHHIAWQVADQLIVGDVAGVKIGQGPVVPPCPPPDINLEDWQQSIDLIRNLKPQGIWLTHYGKVETIETHLQELSARLVRYANWMKVYFDKGASPEEVTPLFSAMAARDLTEHGVTSEVALNQYELANPAWMSVAGLLRYWKKRSASEA